MPCATIAVGIHLRYVLDMSMDSREGEKLSRLISTPLAKWVPFTATLVAVGNFIRVIASVITRLGLRRISNRATGAVARSVIGPWSVQSPYSAHTLPCTVFVQTLSSAPPRPRIFARWRGSGNRCSGKYRAIQSNKKTSPCRNLPRKTSARRWHCLSLLKLSPTIDNHLSM